MKVFWLTAVLLCTRFFLFAQNTFSVSDNLQLVQLSPHVFIHAGYLQTEEYGRVACNGLLYVDGNEAVIMDTPPDSAQSVSLLQWIEKNMPGVVVRAVIINHFHNDCLGGLSVFHHKGIPSYASVGTLLKTKEKGLPQPMHAFGVEAVVMVNGKKVISRYFGEAHTSDNIVTWLPEERLLFGGCMIKSIGSGKGHLADANVREWSNTVRKVKDAYGVAETVVPGHGAAGGADLLEYTINLFELK